MIVIDKYDHDCNDEYDDGVKMMTLFNFFLTKCYIDVR